MYLKNRGLTAHDVLRYNMHYVTEGEYKNRIIIPSYNEDGKLNFFTGRDFFDTNHMPYKNPKWRKDIVGFEYHINWKYPVIVCEGVFDAMAIKLNAIPLFGKTVPEKLKQKLNHKQVREIYIALDSDAIENAVRMAQEFMKEGRSVYLAELPDETDPAKLGFVEVHKVLRKAKELTFKEVVSMKLA